MTALVPCAYSIMIMYDLYAQNYPLQCLVSNVRNVPQDCHVVMPDAVVQTTVGI